MLSAVHATRIQLWSLSVSGLAWIALSWRGVPEQVAGSSNTHQDVLVSLLVYGSPYSVFLRSLAFFVSDRISVKAESIRFYEEQ